MFDAVDWARVKFREWLGAPAWVDHGLQVTNTFARGLEANIEALKAENVKLLARIGGLERQATISEEIIAEAHKKLEIDIAHLDDQFGKQSISINGLEIIRIADSADVSGLASQLAAHGDRILELETVNKDPAVPEKQEAPRSRGWERVRARLEIGNG